MNNRSMIVQCFDAVFKYEEVAALLEICHAVDVSLRTLYGILRKQKAKTYWKSNGCFTALCCTNNERLRLVGDELWDVACTMVKNQTGYDILMVMISLSPLVL